MRTYFDTSALVPLYVEEDFSAGADREAKRSGRIPFTAQHRLELRNALRLACGSWKRITPEQFAAALAKIDEHIESRRLVPTALDLAQVFERADMLSKEHWTKAPCRSFDIVHVAAALELRARRFVSSDPRQIDLARAAGLEVADLKQVKPTRKAKP